MKFVEKSVSKRETYDFKLLDFNFYNKKTSFPNADEDDEDGGGASELPAFRVQMFGMNEAGETACIVAENFAPYFYVMVPDNWNANKKEEFLVHLKLKLGGFYQKTLRVNGCKTIMRRKLYGFDAGREYKFLRLEFENMAGYNKAVNLWYSSYEDGHKLLTAGYRFGGANLKIYESNIPAILRMFHVNNISPSGWVQIPVKKVTYRGSKSFTHCDYEFCIDNRDIKALPNKDVNVPYKCASFDIEASSSHGLFPLPKKGYNLLATNIYNYFYKCGYTQTQINNKQEFIAILHHAFGTAENYAKYGNVVGENKIGENTIEPVFLKDATTGTSVAEVNTWCIQLLRLTSNVSRMLQTSSKYNTLDNIFDRFNSTGGSSGGSSGDDDDENAGGAAADGEADEEGYMEEFVDNNAEEIEPDFIDNSGNLIKEEELSYFDPATFIGGSGNDNNSVILDLLGEIYAIGGGQTPAQGKDHKSYIKEIDRLLCSICPKLEGDKVVIIGTTLMRYGEKEPYLNHVIVLNTCTDMPNVANGVVESVATERELLLAWTAFIQRENPDIVYGYNTDGFDYEFMFHRADENDCLEEFLKLGRNRDEVCNGGSPFATAKDGAQYHLSETNIKLASGEYTMKYINMIGRMQFDLYMYFRREHTLDGYTLDFVSGHFISDGITAITPNPVSRTSIMKTQNITGLIVGSYIHLKEISNSATYYNGGEKFEILEIRAATSEVVIAGLPTPDTTKVLKWGLAKDDITHHDIFRLINGSSSDRAIVAKYCVQDCNLVHYLINKNDIITDYVEMANICSVPINYLVTRGQGIKLFSLLAKFCRDNATLIPVIEKRGDGGYEGAIVLKPKCDLYLNIPVAVNDYNSLYPSAIISENISHDSKVWTREYNLAGEMIHETGEKDTDGTFMYDNLNGYDYVNIQYDTYKWVRNPAKPKAKAKKVLCGYKICRFAQFTDGRKAILPAMLDYLLTQRKNTRAVQKQTKDANYKQTLEMRQLNYKKSANSVYGNCGASTSMFCEKDVAASTTAVGRMNITYAKRIIEEVYGNTTCVSTVAAEKWGEPVLTNAEYIYGDSVAAYTPVYLRIHGNDNHKGRNKYMYDNLCIIEEVALKYGAATWTLCKEPGREDKEVCELSGVDTWSDAGWTPVHRIIRHRLAAHKQMMRITTRDGSWVDVTDDHSLVLGDAKRTIIKPADVKVGDVLLGSKTPNGGFAFMDTTVAAVELIDYVDDYVYDFTTENHHFSAGVGNIVVHNTDSVFYTFNLKRVDGTPIVGKDALEITIELAKEVGNLASSFLKLPHNWEYEKTFMPFCLLSKKRYVGILYEDDPNKGKRKEMGIVLKRRDNAPIVKDIYGGIIDILLKKQDILKAVDFLKEQLQAVAAEKVPISKLVVTKQVRSGYARPESIAHKVLADRIGDREPGNKPKPGDRINFAFIHNPHAKLQGDKIETPAFIIANKLKMDYAHYITNQIMKPVRQVFALVLERIWELQGKHPKIAAYRRELKSIENKVRAESRLILNKTARAEWFETRLADKVDDYKNAEVFKLLFETVLRDLNNRKAGNQAITGFFGVRAAMPAATAAVEAIDAKDANTEEQLPQQPQAAAVAPKKVVKRSIVKKTAIK